MSCVPVTTPCERYKARLLQAEDALHALRLGQSTELVQHNGKVVRFQPANSGALSSYIETLRRLCAGCDGVPQRGGRRIIGVIPR